MLLHERMRVGELEMGRAGRLLAQSAAAGYWNSATLVHQPEPMVADRVFRKLVGIIQQCER